MFKQWPPLFACNYLADDLTLATLHLYNTVATVRYASVAFRCVGIPFRAALNGPWTGSVILFYLSNMDFGNPEYVEYRLKRSLTFFRVYVKYVIVKMTIIFDRDRDIRDKKNIRSQKTFPNPLTPNNPAYPLVRSNSQ